MICAASEMACIPFVRSPSLAFRGWHCSHAENMSGLGILQSSASMSCVKISFDGRRLETSPLPVRLPFDSRVLTDLRLGRNYQGQPLSRSDLHTMSLGWHPRSGMFEKHAAHGSQPIEIVYAVKMLHTGTPSTQRPPYLPSYRRRCLKLQGSVIASILLVP
ncbi:hypothetical protein BD309DRAFT_41152 [Dichomitus squalens]|uniref:Uncharacterized protein n=1 Tax=Dichomitus squalens TaxID=114155 RepID=A0A4Q9NSS2_9APHY|nr:hypothetical protein BD311DRAFT_125962 [Dichomitus squalens]TBU44368.1 hypothetical protein BD309DRAFT_41152 [Dichomitus squalens]TBU58613.1 hypothetical protein BD310DRAFT_453050 [Dichomitus squalens]